jgi:hypothetical protein
MINTVKANPSRLSKLRGSDGRAVQGQIHGKGGEQCVDVAFHRNATQNTNHVQTHKSIGPITAHKLQPKKAVKVADVIGYLDENM